MKYLLPALLTLSLNVGADTTTTLKKEAAKNGDVKTTITTKNPGGNSTTVINNTKDEETKSKKIYADIAKCELKLSANKSPMGTFEMQTHGFTNGKCKFTQKLITAPGVGQLVTCLFTKDQLKEIETKDVNALTQYQTDEKVCSITDLNGKK